MPGVTRRPRLVLGLTGGIASGKSTVLEMFRRAGAAVVDCDKIARRAVQPGGPAYRKVLRRFGRRVLARGGRVDRAVLGGIVFSDRSQRKALERIVHPEVLKTVRRLVGARRGLVVVDVPLLFEAGWQKWMDGTALVWTPEAVQKQRLARRNGLSPSQAGRLMRLQWPLARKKRLADHVIDNSGPPDRTRKQVRALVLELSRRMNKTGRGQGQERA